MFIQRVSALVVGIHDPRQRVELMKRRWGGKGPFQRRRALAPRIVGRRLLASEGVEHTVHEHEQADEEDIGAHGRDEVPAREGVRVIRITTRHAGQAEEVLRKEQHVGADERDPEVQLADALRIHMASDFREPVVDTSEDPKDGAERQHIVEVGHDVVGVVQVAVNGRVRQHHAGDAADREHEDEPDGPVHRRREADGAAPHGGDPGEDLHTGRNRDHHGGEHEVGLRLEREADRVHVVCPHDAADHADRRHGVGHAEIAEDRLLRERRDNVADDAEGRQDHDVDFGMAEEPEQVLVEHRIAAARRLKEGGAEIAVGEQHRDRAREHRKGDQKKKSRDQHTPGKQRHLVQRHAGGAHVEDGGDEVDRAQDR